MSALITSGESLKALTVVRSLGHRNIPLTVGSANQYSLASCSRYVKSDFRYPSPSLSIGTYIQALTHYLERNHHDVLIPVHSNDTLLISQYRKNFEPFTSIPLPSYDSMNTLNDKGKLAQIAEELSIPIPKTFLPSKYSSIQEIADKVQYPAVIKLRNRTSSTGQTYVYNSRDLCTQYKSKIKIYDLLPKEYPIIQEYVEGIGYGVSFLYNQGDIRAKFTHKRIREYPITGGPSTYRISTKHNKMEAFAELLLTHHHWHGVAMVEFKLTPDGKPILIEVNPRFWGSLNMAIISGVDFPYLLYQMATDGDVPRVMNYQTGLVSMNYLSDTIARFEHMKNHRNINNIKDSLFCPYHDDIISLEDPLPFFRFIIQGIQQKIG
jgi:predicted ATP-grasp superfamily ATP-dependent carboligase